MQPTTNNVLSKTERKWNSMNVRGLDLFCKDHLRTFRRRVRRGVPSKYRWKSWLLLTELQEFLAQKECGSRIVELFCTPVSKKAPEGTDPDLNALAYTEMVAKWTEDYKTRLIAESQNLSPKEYYDHLASTPSAFQSLIEIDISRTFPEIQRFTTETQTKLLHVLNAYANFAPHVGYCQGMNFICGFIFLVADEDMSLCRKEADGGVDAYEVFYFLTLMMSRYHLHGFYREGFPLLDIFVERYEETCRWTSPALMNHFVNENVLPPVYIHQWYLTLFVTSLPRGATVVLWDYILASNLHALVPITLSLLSILQTFLLRLRFEGIVKFLKSLKNSGNCDEYRIGRMLVKQADELLIKAASPPPNGLVVAFDDLTDIDWPRLLWQHSDHHHETINLAIDEDDSGGGINGADSNPFDNLAVGSDPDEDEEPPETNTTVANHTSATAIHQSKQTDSKTAYKVKNFFSRHH